MGLEITGKLFKLQPEVTGEGKNGTWRKQEFVIETFDAYPKKVCFELWGDKLRMLDGFNEGDTMKVSFDIESRPYQDRWFTGAKAWRVERDSEGSNTTSSNSSSSSNNNTRTNAPIDKDPFPDELSSTGGSGGEDLPF
jgi:hypothetical protein